MKSLKALSLAAGAAVVLGAAQIPVSAEGDVVYGTMNIPYTAFYAAELGENAREVDAVTSATKSKALKNGEGELFEGSYNNGTDTILGVTYPVAISQTDLNALGSDNYGFTKLDTVPSAYKNVTVSGGKASFSAVQDASPETVSAGVKLSTETPWGDYLIDITDQPENFDKLYRGAILKTADGSAFAMRHEQNIWRGEIAWSSGIKTSEPHGNQLDYAAYQDLMGKTLTQIVLITKDGYVTVNTNTYIPVKFTNSLTVNEGDAGTNKTSFTEEGFPADYKKVYTVAEGFSVANGEISYLNANPGSYTLKISDENGKYADVSSSFVLATDALPVKYADGKLVAADGFTDEQAANFIRNISSVKVNEGTFSASGKGAVKVFDENGAIDFNAEGRNGKAFENGESGTYAVIVNATGYRNALSISLDGSAAETTATTSETTSTTTNTTGTTAKTTAAKGTAAASPKTGDAGTAAAVALLATAGAVSVLTAKKRKSADR